MGDFDDLPFGACSTSEEVVGLFRTIAGRVGVDRCAIYALLPFHSVAATETPLYTWGFSEQWQQDYRLALADRNDRIADLIIEKGRPALWRTVNLFEDVSESNRNTINNFLSHWRDRLVSIPFYGPYGYQFLITLAFKHAVNDSIDPRILLVSRVGNNALRRYVELYREETLPRLALSDREREVLQRMAIGETKKQVARSLGVSASSIDTYQRRIFSKLEVGDRTAAVVRGLSMGLIKLLRGGPARA